MKRLKEKLALSAVTLAASPVAIAQGMHAESIITTALAALVALFAGMAFSLAAAEVLRQWCSHTY